MRIHTVISCLTVIGMGLCLHSCQSTLSQEPTSHILLDFSTSFQTDQIQTIDARVEVVTSKNGNSLAVETGVNKSKPGLIISQPADQPWDLVGAFQVVADVQNIGDEPIQVEMFVGNDPDGLIQWYCSDYVDLAPGQKGTITVDLAWTPWAFDPQPEMRGMRGAPGIIKTDQRKIEDVRFFARYATDAHAFAIHEVRTVGRLSYRDTAAFFPFIDSFGQYKHRDWQGKIHTEAELKAEAARESASIREQAGPENRSQYGGWTAGPKLKATGFFRAEKYQDKWYMVDPEGYLFWSAGMNCVSSLTGLTGTQGRESYFEGLPEAKDELAQFYAEGNWASHGYYMDKLPFTAYHFYQANLYRKYGADWLQKFRENVHKRFKSWGLTTIGNVSDMAVNQMHQTPYTGTVWINGTPKIEGSNGYWGKFHDVFDPGFRQAVRTSMISQKSGADDPWCMGFFVDNELSWGDVGSLSLGALRSPSSQPAKQEFIRDLRLKYGHISALNAVWGTDHTSWEHLLSSQVAPDSILAEADLAAFYAKIAETYFRTIKEELNRMAPNQYYLGCRFAWANNEPTIKAAAEYADILSFNKYEYSVEGMILPEGIDKPIMIGEFHFGALDRGLFHVGVKKAQSQAERGEMYEAYIKGALRNPAIVGAHWFQYIDEATTGREDGENYNVGFVDICDTPYAELIDKVRETTYGMYRYRLEH